MPEPFLTTADVAELFKLNAETVYLLIAQQGLPATKIGGQWRFDESEIREWFKERRSLSAPGDSEDLRQPRPDQEAQRRPESSLRGKTHAGPDGRMC